MCELKPKVAFRPATIAFNRLSGKAIDLVAATTEFDTQVKCRRAVRRTIAVLVDYIDNLGSGYDTQLRSGFEYACQQHDINLLFVVGRALESTDPISAAHNGVYQLVQGHGIDGTILIAPGIASNCGTARLLQLSQEQLPAPICSIGIELPGIPSIVIDNHLGMAAVLEHLIDVHNCRRIAFIGGPTKNADALARFQVYRQVLVGRNLQFAPELVALGDLTLPTGMLAANVLLECGSKFDCIVAANDEMALGAIEALRQHGMRVPRDMRVAGFDDLVNARFSNPPLTTARQPFEKMAALAVSHIVAQWARREVPMLTRLPVEVVARRSCGCLFRKGRHTIPPAPELLPPGLLTGRQTQRLADQLDQILTQPRRDSCGAGQRLIRAVNGELEGQRDAFQTELETLLDRAHDSDEFFDDVQTAVTLLRDEFNSIGATQFEELWDTARRTVALANTRAHSERRRNIELTYQGLLRAGERLSSVSDVASLTCILAEELPLIPMSDVLFARCVPGKRELLEPFFVLNKGARIIPVQMPIHAAQFSALIAQCCEGQHTAFVLPLTFETHNLGVAVIGHHLIQGAYGMLREQVSFALRTVELHDELAKRVELHERSVQERIAATARIETLSIIAGGVAHDLNSALSPLVALPDVILRLVDQLGVDSSPNGQRLRAYVGTIKSAAHRATQTIRDLMTLGRQGRTAKTTLDLNWVAASCVSAESSLSIQQEGPRISVDMQLYPHPLLVNGSQYHVERAISNLLRNAIEAIGDHGMLTMRTSVARFDKPAGGHETVSPGIYALVAVSDTGPGIPHDLIGRVFEPFFTNKILRDGSGSGLGLSIVHGVVKEHEGFVDVSSEQGQGTTFTLYFPLAKLPQSVASGSDAPHATQGDGHQGRAAITSDASCLSVPPGTNAAQ